MPFVPMAYAVAGAIASSAEYNKIVDNVNDLNTRLTLREGVAVGDTQNTAGTTTSTVYTPTLTGGTTCSFTFVAPGSGRVLVSHNCNLEATSGNLALCGFELRTGSTIGSGTLVVGTTNNDEVLTAGSQANFGRSRLVTGLTPGATYNIRMMFAVTSGTGTFKSKHLNVTPA